MSAFTALVEGARQREAQEQRATQATDAALLADVRAPADLAAAIRSHPGNRDDLIRQAHARFGNGFVAEALPLVALPDNLARGAAPGALETSALRDAEHNSQGREVNAYDSAAVLPFNERGWDAPAILTKVGQRDNLAGTDSDGNRCVQAVGIASHVLRGPEAVVAYLQHMLADAGHGAARPTPRQMSARSVLSRVCDRLRGRVATFDDLSWAQEALHDLTVAAENQGTPDPGVAREIAPTATTSAVAMSQWCDGAADVLAAAHGLGEGDQLVLTAWEVTFNAEIFAWNMANDGHAHDIAVDGRQVHEQRLQRGHKPPSASIVNGRDTLHGHQLLVTRESGELRLYEPETSPGGHYLPLTAATLRQYFHDAPAESLYRYMRLDQHIRPR